MMLCTVSRRAQLHDDKLLQAADFCINRGSFVHLNLHMVAFKMQRLAFMQQVSLQSRFTFFLG